MTYQEIKNFINTYIVQNGVNAITGAQLNTILNELADYKGFDSVFVTTLPAGSDATVTVQGMNLVLGIPKGADGRDGQNAVNPFKGWYTTDNIPTEGQAGDYCNVSDTSVTPHTVTIYRWSTSLNRFVDTGEVPDTVTGETFASGETLQQVAIDGTNLVNPVNTADATQPVLAKAADVMQLKAKLEGVTASDVKASNYQVANGYIACRNYSTTRVAGSYYTDSSKKTAFIGLCDSKSVRFLGLKVRSTDYSVGYVYLNIDDIDNFVSNLLNGVDLSSYIVGAVHPFSIDSDLPSDNPTELVEISSDNPSGANYIALFYDSNPSSKFDVKDTNFYCYLQSGGTVMDLIDDVKKTLYDYKPLTFEDLGMGAIPDSPTDNTPITSQVVTSSTYRIYQFDITGRNTLKCEGIVGDHNLTRYIYFFADSNNVFISKDLLKGERNLSWSDYMLSVPHGAKYLYVNVINLERSYYQVEGLEEKNFVTEDEIEGLPERISAVEEEVDDITTVLSKVGDIISDFTITAGTRLEHQEVGKTISQCEHSSAVLSYRKYEIVPGKTYNYNATYGKINDYIIPVVWTDENEVIIKVEPFRCDVSRYSTFENERIVAPQGAKYLFMNVTGKYKSVTSLAEVVAIYSETLAEKKTIRLLSVGNSYSQDALAYVPFIIKNMGVNANIDIAILMQSGAGLDDHVSNFDNETAAYEFWRNTGTGIWKKRTNNVTIQWALENYKWDLILLQQASSPAFYRYENYYQPYLNKLINSIAAFVQYPIKFGWYAVQSKARGSDGGTPWSEETINSHWQSIMENAKSVIDETVCEFLVPVSTAIQNARTIPSIKAIGSYASNGGNGVGYLENSDGVHLQEGLPCQIAAYVFVIALLDLYGFQYSINGESTIVDSDWETGKNIPAPHGSPVGSNETNILIAQKCAIMAVKFPYVTTDMNYIIYPS